VKPDRKLVTKWGQGDLFGLPLAVSSAASLGNIMVMSNPMIASYSSMLQARAANEHVTWP
jgi:hypothetical protein